MSVLPFCWAFVCDPPLRYEDAQDIQDPITKSRIKAPQGIITFRSDAVEVEDHQFQDQPHVVKLDILRCNGSEGSIKCKLQTEGLSAVPGVDYEEMDETIEFEDGETLKEVELSIYPQRQTEPDDVLQLVLSEVEGDAFFNPNDDGGRAPGAQKRGAERHGLLVLGLR
eukprot:g8141.t1